MGFIEVTLIDGTKAFLNVGQIVFFSEQGIRTTERLMVVKESYQEVQEKMRDAGVKAYSLS